jgi:hypothetical protein
MLFSVAPLISSHERGILMLLQKQWNGSAALQAENIVGSFLESFFRLRNDKEGTKPYINQFGYPLVSDLESASEICRRKLPKRSRSESYLYFVVQDLQSEKFRLHVKVPRWIHLSLLNTHRGFFEVSLPPNAYDTWESLDATQNPNLSGDWSTGFISFFDKPKNREWPLSHATPLKNSRHYRMSEFLLRNQHPFLRTIFSLCLD